MDIRDLLRQEARRAHERHCGTQPLRAQRTPTEYRIAQCIDSIDRYVGRHTPLPALRLMAPGWLDGFHSFLTGPDMGLSEATATERTRRVMACLRLAIKARVLPNIPLLDDGSQREIDRLEEIDPRRDMETLLSLYNFRREKLEATDADSSQATELRHRTTALAYAILATLLCGVGYEGLTQLRRSDLDGSMLHLTHAEVTVELPAEVLDILRWLIPEGDSQQLLIPDGSALTGERLRTMAMAELATLSLINRDGFAHPMTQWIEMARSCGTDARDCRRIIGYLTAPDPTSQDRELVHGTFLTVARSLRYLGYKWYCVRSLSQAFQEYKRTDDATRGQLLLDAIRREAAVKPIDTFAPHERTYRQRGGSKVTLRDRFLDSLLFIKVNYAQLETVNRYLMARRSGFIYSDREADSVRFAPISSDEIDLLRYILEIKRSHRIDPTMADARRRLLGVQARITQGYYDGFQGTICRVKLDADSHVRHVELHFEDSGKKIALTLDPAYLHLLTTP